MTPIGIGAALAATLISALVVFLTRAFPFIVFSYRDPPRIISFIEKYIPPMIIAVLVVYCLKDVEFASRPWGLPSVISLGATAILHIRKRNAMISIFGGTLLYMALSRLPF